MFRFIVVVLASVTVLGPSAGCRSSQFFREHPPVPLSLEAAASPRDRNSTTAVVVYTTDNEPPDEDALSRRAKNILVLSGGGMNGAFSAGMLVGWTGTGERPDFDVVTGVSTGALIAPFAFLGKEYDGQLKHLYTSESAAHIYKMLPMFLWKEAAASSEPLRNQIRDVVTANFVERIAQEHCRGRRLYIGTTNLDTQKSVVWDVGAIAAGSDPCKVELVQNVMLASCSVPGLLPPIAINVEIDGRRYTELHVDGGVSASMFLLPQTLDLNSEGILSEKASQATVYTIVAGKANPDPVPVKKGLLNLSGASLSGVLRAQQEHELTQIYLLTYFANAQFRLAAIPQEYVMPSSSMEFDVQAMRALFAEGHRLGRTSMGWVDAPPGIDPEKWAVPRTGSQLVSRSVAVSETP